MAEIKFKNVETISVLAMVERYCDLRISETRENEPERFVFNDDAPQDEWKRFEKAFGYIPCDFGHYELADERKQGYIDAMVEIAEMMERMLSER